MVEEFAQIECKLGEELKDCGTRNISSEEFLGLKKKLGMANQLINTFQKQKERKKELWDSLFVELQKLNELWLGEFNLIKTELDKVGSSGASISITSGYKEDKQAFLAFMKSVFKGSGIRETTFQGIVDAYTDFIAVFLDFKNAKGLRH